MGKQPYHKYVFDAKNRKFVGKFEEMYQNEEVGNYDSWFQEDLTHLGKQISLLVLSSYNFDPILDIGCGKGSFTSLLKKGDNAVVGVDISKTAISKAKARHKNVEFLTLTVAEALDIERRWDLIVMMEILSYLENWKEILAKTAKRTSYVYISLYLPSNPIGFVRSLRALRTEVCKYFDIKTELAWNSETVFILGKTRAPK